MAHQCDISLLVNLIKLAQVMLHDIHALFLYSNLCLLYVFVILGASEEPTAGQSNYNDHVHVQYMESSLFS